MDKNSNIFKKLLSLITYKTPDKKKEFFIPEVNEKGYHADENEQEDYISDNIDDNLKYLKNEFNYPTNKDIVIREFKAMGKYRAFIVYIDGMADRNTINNFILRPLLKSKGANKGEEVRLEYILENVIETDQVQKVTKSNKIIDEILYGDTGLYIDGWDFYIFSETKGFDKRGVENPKTEAVVRGPQEAFNENLRTNVTLLRRSIKNKGFTTEFIKIGKQSNKLCAICYINGLINPAIVTEVKRRLNGIDTAEIESSGMVEQFIEDSPMNLVPTILSTERPDKASLNMLDGKVAIVVDGSPFVLVAPITVIDIFHSPEDVTVRWQYGTLIRFVRVYAILVAMLLPGLYIAATNFHQEMIPTEILIAIAKARENVPFPTIIEILLMELSFELIREAGIRVPGMLGNTIGIIGALILGQAAVQADLISPVIIIIIATTGLGSFAIPDFSFALGIRLLRILFILAGYSLGFYGITLMLVVVASLGFDIKSFGVPFFSSYAPKVRKSFDKVIRYPVWKQEFRPDEFNPLNVRQQPKISRKWTEQCEDKKNE
ncbi:spore germination protein [Clostridium hydrogenum]|uniref:spore germination protein n=1 Tax=Clostridium hydrogenum TaxID=2855764 RepID=UPI001F240C60|nr:spore germination protein [Clostridium hydrogenum]